MGLWIDGAAIFGGLGYLVWLLFMKNTKEKSKGPAEKTQNKRTKTPVKKSSLLLQFQDFPPTSHPEFYKENPTFSFQQNFPETQLDKSIPNHSIHSQCHPYR